MEPIVSLEAVSLIYHSEEAETKAILNINMDVYPGEFVAIVGPSGCGKSTALSLIAGLIAPSTGEVKLLGSVVNGPNQAVGYMLQRDHLFDWRTIWQNVILGLQVRGINTAENREHALELLKLYGLEQFKNHYPRELSGGMRQKVALIRTLALDPQLMLLDEPFSSLDYQARLALSEEIRDIIRRENKTAILVTHDISEAISMAQRVFVFSRRPSHIKAVFEIDLPERNPIERRNSARFKDFFDLIWRELDMHVE